jgi:presenilin-like A22 family membrane protease
MEKEKLSLKKDILPIFFMCCLFLLIYAIAISITIPFQQADMEAFEDSGDPMNLVFIFSIVIVMTAIILLIAKFWKKRLIQLIIIGAVGYTSAVVFNPIYDIFIPKSWTVTIPIPNIVSIVISISVILSIISALVLVILLFKYPEWYVIDICGIFVGAGAIAIFGISLDILLIIILLIILAIYDAISVYKTKHMIDLADTVMDLKLPVLLVIPKILKYSLIKETKSLKDKLKEDEKRDAFFMGLGDVVMPGILVIAVYFYAINNNLPGLPIALGVILGILAGFMVLMTFVIKGKPQAGLPCLCGGAIIGYLISSYILFGELIGLSLQF